MKMTIILNFCNTGPLCRYIFFKYKSSCFLRNICGIKSFQGQELQNRFNKHGHGPHKSDLKMKTKKKGKAKSSVPKDLSSIIKPIPYTTTHDASAAHDMVGQKVQKDAVFKILKTFFEKPEMKRFAADQGLDSQLFFQTYISFRKHCSDLDNISSDLYITFSDIIAKAGAVDDILPFFMDHAREIFPHLECLPDLQAISDLRNPAWWYPDARKLERKIIYHAGPTNSGKTYHALQKFLTAKSGIYCGPLKLLAAEVFKKSNEQGTRCDLVTGEERRYANPDATPANHVACTVEMTSLIDHYEVAVIDEIQMLKDQERGGAWTRALLGVCADEIHLCGEATCIDLVKDMLFEIGEDVEVRRYKRLTDLVYLDKAVESFDNIRPGDCIVCFNRNDIYKISQQLEMRGLQSAVIYGSLPPGTKLAQSEKFNNPDDPCKVMVATDAIGMGLNLSIKRVIFYSLMKPTKTENGDLEMDVVSTSQALQIGGRAGRYGTMFATGEVTTFFKDDLKLLNDVINQKLETTEKAGLNPTAEQIETFAYHLPKASLKDLIDIFIFMSRLDGNRYFLCNMDTFKFIAGMLEHVNLPLRVRYVFCLAPIKVTEAFICTMLLKFARQFQTGYPLTYNWLISKLGLIRHPKTIYDLVQLENIFDVIELYLWLSIRFRDMFQDYSEVQELQKELDTVIQEGVINMNLLLKKSETSKSQNVGLNLLDSTQKKDAFTFNSIIDKQSINTDSTKLDNKLPKKSEHQQLSKTLTKAKILSPQMLQQLRNEWQDQYKDDLKKELEELKHKIEHEESKKQETSKDTVGMENDKKTDE